MPRSGGAVIPMKDEVVILAGVRQPEAEPWEPFAAPALDFLEQLSREIRRERRQYEQLAAFGFWCRRSHMEEFKKRYEDGRSRLGRGVIFHIPASNVPVLFGYSLVMGLLAGNSCSVRISSKSREQDQILCRIMDRILLRPEYKRMRRRISVFSSQRDSTAVREALSGCAGCVVWGGDSTIMEIRSMPIRPDAVQLNFPDRYSICILDTLQLGYMTEEELKNLARRFYNDTYLLDQNACSSPVFVIWNQEEESKEAENARVRWWNAVDGEARSYELTAHKAMAKYELLCRYAMSLGGEIKISRYGNRLYTMGLGDIPSDIDQLRGTFGMFFEYLGDWRKALTRLASGRLQTITYHGIEEQKIVDFVIKNHLLGVHRIVPAGRAADMDPVWDGQDFIAVLSRQIGREAQDAFV
ncbi:acyl-CoA reductase [Lacrimispora defluvii]|uniref:Acyl-CoA reductase n=1 Tax=Lacrimispora defluvii TaxID=2719233 RepID=A0ABX1VWJ3_9FIRM|nr:acyl-CoA reductase [Lacrimispora defluvii]NNJ32134.1 acyl-CoA reductase [Lacrimispora defluvii]